ncbi:MAG TPA: hypothetical protein VFD84_18050, partial [Candidatus Binatia bacterium]|nr:hypothetical protein [Candidatus Binatia bacterium]
MRGPRTRGRFGARSRRRALRAAGLLLGGALALPAARSAAAPVELMVLPSSHDTFVGSRVGRPAGKRGYLRVGSRQTALLQFDLTPIAGGVKVEAGRLRLFCFRFPASPEAGVIAAHEVTGPWDERT